MKHRSRQAQRVQRAIFAHLRQRLPPGAFAFHVPDNGKHKPVESATRKALGVVPGVPVLIAIRQGRMPAVEIKAEGGRATRKQVDAIGKIEAAGACTCIKEGLDRALAPVLEDLHLYRGCAT